jgi:hypothetical protein
MNYTTELQVKSCLAEMSDSMNVMNRPQGKKLKENRYQFRLCWTTKDQILILIRKARKASSSHHHLGNHHLGDLPEIEGRDNSVEI